MTNSVAADVAIRLQAIATPERTTHELRAVIFGTIGVITDEIAKAEHKRVAVAGLALLADHGGTPTFHDATGGLMFDLTGYDLSPVDRAAVALVRARQPAADTGSSDHLAWRLVEETSEHLALHLSMLRAVAQTLACEAIHRSSLEVASS